MCNFRNDGLQLLLLYCATVASAAPARATPAVAHVARGVGPGQGVARRRPTSHEPDSDLCRLVSNESVPRLRFVSQNDEKNVYLTCRLV